MDDAYSMARNLETAANLWQQGLNTFSRSIVRSFSEAWEGASAEAAKTTIQTYVTDANQLTGPIETLANHIVSAAEAVVNAKKAMPQGIHIDATSWLWPPHRFSLEDKQGADRQQAWEAYQNLYVKPLNRIDTTIPILPKPTAASHSLDIAPGKNVTPGVDMNPFTAVDNTTTNNKTENDSQQNSANNQNQSTDKDSTVPANTNSGAGTNSGTGTGNPADSTASTHPTGLESAASTEPSSYSSGTGGAGGFGGGSEPGKTSGGTGQGVPSTGTKSAARNTAPAAYRTDTGTSGLASMGGMTGGHGKGEDREHKTADYLVNADHLEEWIGELRVNLPGGVIGADPEYNDEPHHQ
ncbi:hypothetical protein [Nocardia miyunensis]|uniref:hypothetical protein n=1 Tax=Nocardia miyunensis TaxID=282684 RepID=UPI000834EDFA|nr:hypothetical protein [Nocardia miyunensis]